MASKFVQLVSVVALAGGLYVAADGQSKTVAVVTPPTVKVAPKVFVVVPKATPKPAPAVQERLPAIKAPAPIIKLERKGKDLKKNRLQKKSTKIAGGHCDRVRSAVQARSRHVPATCDELRRGNACLTPELRATARSNATSAQMAKGASCLFSG